MKCNGNCEEHEGHLGEVQKVLVYGGGFKTPFRFDYCENAIKEDTRRGFEVVVITEDRQRELIEKGSWDSLDSRELDYISA